jgi:hypothetical protein
VTGDVSAVTPKLAQGETAKLLHADKLLAWVFPPLPPEPDEPSSTWAEKRRPILWLGGAEGTWKQVAAKYQDQIKDRLTPDKSVEALSASLVTGKSSAVEKIAAIARHVQKEYGYKAIEFGVRARRPNEAAETVKLRYGDCKDHSLLLHHLLRAAGIESHLALVNTNWHLQPSLPSLDQFNHMVVHVPALGKGWLIDATDKTLDLGRYRAGYLWHSHALVLHPEEPCLLPPRGPIETGSCDVSSKRTLTPSGDDWGVDENLTITGYYASAMRDAFTGLSADEQFQKAQRILAAQGAAQLETFRFEYLDDPAQPASLHLFYKVRNAIRGTARSAQIPAFWESDYLGTSFVKARRTPFECRYPMRLVSDVSVILPAEPTPDSLDALPQKGDSEFCFWKLEHKPALATSGQPKMNLRFEFTAKPGMHPATKYSAFHDAWEAARRSWDRQVSWNAK